MTGERSGFHTPSPGSPLRFYADASGRLVAYVIDALVVSVIIFAAAIALSVLVGPAVSFQTTIVTVDRGRAILQGVVATAINFFYFVFLWRKFRATLGQRLLKLEVVSVSGGAAGIGQAVTRWILLSGPLVLVAWPAVLGQNALWIDLAVLAWYPVLLFTTALSPTKRGLHDWAARTIVIRTARAVEFGEFGPPKDPVVR
jgi:uncharacterized RDD family membrane protein YckC